MIDARTAQPGSRNRFDSVTKRFVLALALVPIVPASSAIGVAVAEKLTPAAFDGVWWFHLLLTLFWMAGFIGVWRTAVVWTFGRSGLTALVSLIPFVQIVFNKPLWNAGCISDDVLRAGQHQLSCGVWTWLAVWVWWGMERTIMATKGSEQFSTPPHRHSLSMARLGTSLGMMPCVVGLFWIVIVFLDTVMGLTGTTSGPFWAYLICAFITLIAWLTIWKKAISWSEHILAWTCGMWLIFVGVPLAFLYLASRKFAGPFWESIFFSAPIIGWGIWLGWTMWYWPMRVDVSGAAGQAPTCLKCGYSLRGLKGTRCPECGDEPTIDELWAASSATNL